MTWLQAVGPLAGVLGLVVAAANAVLQRRGQAHVEFADSERLGHADLVAALELYRQQVPELRAELDRERALRKSEADECRKKYETAQQKLTDLLFLLETRRDP